MQKEVDEKYRQNNDTNRLLRVTFYNIIKGIYKLYISKKHLFLVKK